MRHGNQTVEQVNSTTTTTSAIDSTDTTTTQRANDSTDSIRVETTTSSSEILCKCRVKRQFQNVQLLRGAQCRLRVTLCPLVVNT